jgi:hypothetical protein
MSVEALISCLAPAFDEAGCSELPTSLLRICGGVEISTLAGAFFPFSLRMLMGTAFSSCTPLFFSVVLRDNLPWRRSVFGGDSASSASGTVSVICE